MRAPLAATLMHSNRRRRTGHKQSEASLSSVLLIAPRAAPAGQIFWSPLGLRYWTMERQELIAQAAASGAAPAAPDAEVQKAAPRAGGHHRRGYRANATGGRTKQRPLFYAHCASAQQTLLHMTIAKGTESSPMDIRIVRVAMAEFLATALLVGMGCAGCTTALSHDTIKVSFPSNLGFGITVGILVQVFGHISGAHLNPAVTICGVILEVIEPKMLFVYIPAQILGATMGFGILKMVTPLSILNEDSHHENGFCTTVPSSDLSLFESLSTEFVATSVLILLVCASWDTRNPNCQNVPTQFALAITGLGMIFGQRTGASMNPARSFGPALWNGVWTLHWVYWAAPIVASILTTITYRGIFGFGRAPADDDDAECNELDELGRSRNSAVLLNSA